MLATLVLADANEDGKVDVIVGTKQATRGQISVLLNQGAGTFGTSTSYPLAMPYGGSYEPHVLAVADVNGDGHIDIGAAQAIDNITHVLLGSGNGQLNTDLTYPFTGSFSVAFSDLQGDGRVDMLLLNNRGVSAYLNSGTSAPFETRAPIGFDAMLSSGTGARLLELDGDAKLDLVGMGNPAYPTSSVMIRLATGAGTFGATATIAASYAHRAMLADIDNNGRLDLVMSGNAMPGDVVQALLNRGDGSLAAVPPTVLGDSGFEIDIADLDQDGIRDILVADGYASVANATTVRYHRGFGNGNFGPGTVLWTGNGFYGFAVADLNEDGKRDLVIDSYNNTSGGVGQQILLATGNGAFAPPVVASLSGAGGNHLFARDVNGDDHLDTIGVDVTGVVVSLGDGAGSLGAPIRTTADLIGSDAAFADVNGDGHLDVISPGYRGVIDVLMGRGDGTFRVLTFDAGGPGASVSVGDVNGDGRVDILVDGGYYGLNGLVSILYGRCW